MLPRSVKANLPWLAKPVDLSESQSLSAQTNLLPQHCQSPPGAREAPGPPATIVASRAVWLWSCGQSQEPSCEPWEGEGMSMPILHKPGENWRLDGSCSMKITPGGQEQPLPLPPQHTLRLQKSCHTSIHPQPRLHARASA